MGQAQCLYFIVDYVSSKLPEKWKYLFDSEFLTGTVHEAVSRELQGMSFRVLAGNCANEIYDGNLEPEMQTDEFWRKKVMSLVVLFRDNLNIDVDEELMRKLKQGGSGAQL